MSEVLRATRLQARNIEALNHALAGIPEERVRYQLCWGSWQGPHVHDLGLRAIVDLLLRVKSPAYSVEAATPRHAYEWRVWEGVRQSVAGATAPNSLSLRERVRVRGQGIIAHAMAVVEYPETLAERIMTFARVVGRERFIAGADCRCACAQGHCTSAGTRPSCGPRSRRWSRGHG